MEIILITSLINHNILFMLTHYLIKDTFCMFLQSMQLSFQLFSNSRILSL